MNTFPRGPNFNPFFALQLQSLVFLYVIIVNVELLRKNSQKSETQNLKKKSKKSIFVSTIKKIIQEKFGIIQK